MSHVMKLISNVWMRNMPGSLKLILWPHSSLTIIEIMSLTTPTYYTISYMYMKQASKSCINESHKKIHAEKKSVEVQHISY